MTFCQVICANGMQQTLQNYPYSSNRISASARSIIIHYFQNGELDSIDMVISFCDTLATLNRGWLSGHERILIEVLQGDLAVLKEPAMYRKHLALRDTAAPNDIGIRPPVYDPHRPANPPHDNLSPFLKQNFNQKIRVYRSRHPDLEPLWDFLDIIFDCTQKKVIRYLVNFQGSPYSNFVRYNYFIRYTYRHHGSILGAGLSYLNFDTKSNSFFKDRATFIAFTDTYLLGFALSTLLSISNKGSLSHFIQKGGTIPIGTTFRDLFFEVSAGRIISIQDRVYLTPYLGAGGFHTSPTRNKEFSLPIAWGAKIGLSTNIRVAFYDTKFIAFMPKPDLGFRIDFGLRYSKFYHIRSDLGTYTFFFNLALEVINFGFIRSYDVN